jgi:hypothetical protein
VSKFQPRIGAHDNLYDAMCDAIPEGSPAAAIKVARALEEAARADERRAVEGEIVQWLRGQGAVHPPPRLLADAIEAGAHRVKPGGG